MSCCLFVPSAFCCQHQCVTPTAKTKDRATAFWILTREQLSVVFAIEPTGRWWQWWEWQCNKTWLGFSVTGCSATKTMIWLPLFYRWGNHNLERLRVLSNVTQLTGCMVWLYLIKCPKDMDKMKPLIAIQMYWWWQQLPTFKEHTVHVNTELIMPSVSTQLHTFWVPCTISMAFRVRSHWPGTLWIAHTRLRASPKTGHTNIFPSPTPNSFQLLCWKTWNIFSHHSNLHRNLSEEPHTITVGGRERLLFLFFKQTGLDLTIFSHNENTMVNFYLTVTQTKLWGALLLLLCFLTQ